MHIVCYIVCVPVAAHGHFAIAINTLSRNCTLHSTYNFVQGLTMSKKSYDIYLSMANKDLH